MKVTSADFACCGVGPRDFPQDALPEIALVGRSNVGKSSVINGLANRHGLARISGTPGKTRTVNFYRFNQAWYLVDLPGYGYAKTGAANRQQWLAMIEQYLTSRATLKGVVHLLDLRHPPSEDDRAIHQWMKRFGPPEILVVATKADKISRGRWLNHTTAIRRGLEMLPEEELLVVSSTTRTGFEELKSVLAKIIG